MFGIGNQVGDTVINAMGVRFRGPRGVRFGLQL
jgi:hypothetical protein